jgi:hypothetical protein
MSNPFSIPEEDKEITVAGAVMDNFKPGDLVIIDGKEYTYTGGATFKPYIRKKVRVPTSQQLKAMAQANHQPGITHRMPDGSKYAVMPSGAWRKIK